jgi:hypothetical protein
VILKLSTSKLNIASGPPRDAAERYHLPVSPKRDCGGDACTESELP